MRHSYSKRYTLGLLLSLYLAQGLPAGFITQALPAILRQYHVSLIMIGWSGLLMLPWAMKFLWAPVVDHYFSARVGQSRSWILPLSGIAIGLLVLVSGFDPAGLVHVRTTVVLFALLFVLSLIGATQDIATDGLAVRMLESDSRSAGNAVQVVGYRVGLIVGGGVLLIVMAYWSWQAVFLSMVGLVVLNSLPVLFFREPVWHHAPPVTPAPMPPDEDLRTPWWQRFYAEVQEHFGYFWATPEMRAWLAVLLVYKVADYMSSGMVKPMMVDMGLSLSGIGLWGTIMGSVSSLIGAGLAARLMPYMRRMTALWVFNGLQALTTALYSLIAWLYAQHVPLYGWELYTANCVEHIAAAMAMVALLTVAMDYARPAHAGSDFTFQVCAFTFLGGLGYLISGYLAHGLGYMLQFGISAVLGVILLLPILYWGRHAHPEADQIAQAARLKTVLHATDPER